MGGPIFINKHQSVPVGEGGHGTGAAESPRANDITDVPVRMYFMMSRLSEYAMGLMKWCVHLYADWGYYR